MRRFPRPTRLVAPLALAPALAAAAGPGVNDAPVPAPAVPSASASATTEASSTASVRPPKASARDLRVELGFRLRNLSVPRDILDAWYTDSTDRKSPNPLWPLPGQERPFVAGTGYGMEVAFQQGKGAGIVWFDWIKSRMPEGYWDDREEPPNGTDGDYIRPANNLGIVSFGADYAHEVQMVRLDQTRDAFALAFVVGGGLGVGFLVGDLDEWSEANDGTPAYAQVAAGNPPTSEKSVPRVWPMVDVNAGLKFNFGDRVTLRVEGGLHTLLYYGGSVGVRF